MTPSSHEIRTKAFALDPRFNYLPDEDRYLLAPPKPTYRLNIIGAGIMGQEHLRVTHLEGRAAVHGIYDPNPRSVAAAQSIHTANGSSLTVYDTLEAACNDPAVDGLIIATPNYTHLDVVQVAAQSGKHILLEKPISTTLQDAYTIVQLAKSYPATFQLGLQYRYKSIYSEAIHEVFERGTIGAVKTIGMQEHRIPFLDKVNQWNKFARYSGDTLVEKCCHYFDLLNLFAGAVPVSVYATGSMAVNFRDFEYDGARSDVLDNAMVIITYANGVSAHFNLCMFAPMFYEELVLCGDAGRLKAWEQQDFANGLETESYLEIACGEARPSRKTSVSYPAWIERSGHNGATYYEHAHFVDSMTGEKTDAATAEEGLWSIIVAVAAQESIKRGQVVRVDELLEREEIAL